MRILGKIAKGIGFIVIALILLGVVGMVLSDDDSTTTETPVVQETPPVEETPVVETEPEEAPEADTSVPAEYRTALRSAENYLQFTAMSKGGLYDQLIFEQYTAEQAQYAVDTIETDWNQQALKSAENYLQFTAMSKGGLYDQLIYEQFTPEQAQYAVDNLPALASEGAVPTENENALKSAENYLQFTAMSKGGLYDQLIYEQFTPEQAQYAVDNVQADWNEQALESARNYLEFSPMSNGQLYDQLIYEQFTPEQAQYAIDNL